MEEKSNFELLKEFASKTNREIFLEEKDYHSQFPARYPMVKRLAYIKDSQDLPCYFVLFSDPYYKLAVDTVFCGVYTPVSVPLKTKLTFTKKDIIDRLNPFLKNKIIDTRSQQFDSKVVTKGNDQGLARRLVDSIHFQKTIIDSFKLNELFYYSINDTNIDFVEDFKGKSHFSILNPRRWILDFELIETWFDIIKSLQKILNEKTMYCKQ